jgi:hypothetical protein
MTSRRVLERAIYLASASSREGDSSLQLRAPDERAAGKPDNVASARETSGSAIGVLCAKTASKIGINVALKASRNVGPKNQALGRGALEVANDPLNGLLLLKPRNGAEARALMTSYHQLGSRGGT